MFRKFLIIAIFWFPDLIGAQPPDTLWTKRWDYESEREYIHSVDAIRTGGYIATGYTKFAMEDYRVWTAKIDDDGNDIWLYVEDNGSTTTDAAYYIEETSNRGFIQCGETWSWAPDLQPDAFVRKLDADGNQEWAHLFGANESLDYFTCVREAPAGGYVAVGWTDGHDIWRLSPSGQTLWRSRAPQDLNTWTPEWVEPTADGGFIVPTQYRRTDLNRNVMVLIKINHAGELVWINDEALPGQDPPDGFAYCVREDRDGFLYVCGQVLPGPSRYVSKRNSDGSLIWAHTYPGPITGNALELIVMADCTISVAGYFLDDEFHVHMWLAKISSDGDILWQYEQLGGDFSSITQGRDGSIVASWYPRENLLDDSEDMALIKLEPEVSISLQPWNLVIPANGGWLHYGAQVTNILVNPTPLDAWITVTGPNGNRTPLSSFPVTLQPGATFTRPQIDVYVPAYAPAGTYTLETHLGVAPPDAPPGGPTGSRNMGLGTFTFTKVQAEGVTEHISSEIAAGQNSINPGTVWPKMSDSWDPFTGQPFAVADTDQSSSAAAFSLPTEANLSAYPNPFNATTTITLNLPETSEVTLTVYSIQGRTVTILADAKRMSPGQHRFTFSATHLASGVYLVRATSTAGLDQVQKLMFVR